MIAKALVRQVALRRMRASGEAGPAKDAAASEKAYSDWRNSEVSRHFMQHFDADDVRGKDVLDFGCGGGDLALAVLGLGARSAVGIDLDPESIKACQRREAPGTARFICASSDKTIDLPDASVDRLLCFDVVEHIMAYEEIFREWMRVLRPGGKVLIVWQPWLHPYGHHHYRYLPVPWVHVILNHREINELCAEIVDRPDFERPVWDFDAQGRPINRFRKAIESGGGRKSTYLNELTIAKFERLCRRLGFTFERRAYEPIGSGAVRGIAAALSRAAPGAREFLTAEAVYVLAKP